MTVTSNHRLDTPEAPVFFRAILRRVVPFG
jgi:hypothetical protein